MTDGFKLLIYAGNKNMRIFQFEPMKYKKRFIKNNTEHTPRPTLLNIRTDAENAAQFSLSLHLRFVKTPSLRLTFAVCLKLKN